MMHSKKFSTHKTGGKEEGLKKLCKYRLQPYVGNVVSYLLIDICVYLWEKCRLFFLYVIAVWSCIMYPWGDLFAATVSSYPKEEDLIRWYEGLGLDSHLCVCEFIRLLIL